ncbi:MAG: M20/M25/M40 family metallo-hydrolase, partial [Bacteroidia bacterium]|nr:M20/M25/M40 family metallo-hydrolase [Bacteroidia bacterium]MDW8134589.1 M20/M25/M40 family metallo-hydrolase [Bacteroidia bacterium]
INTKGEVFNGADDNASGTSVLLEVARVLSQLPAPKRTIVFFHTTAEEKGLLGAFRFVRDTVVPLDSIVAVINADMLGRTDTLHKQGENYLYAIGSAKISPILKEIQESVNALCCGWQLDYRYDDPKDPQRLFYRSDHYAFAKEGLPAVFYFGGLHADYHTVEDDPEKIELERLKKTAIFVASLAWTLAHLEPQNH